VRAGGLWGVEVDWRSPQRSFSPGPRELRGTRWPGAFTCGPAKGGSAEGGREVRGKRGDGS